MPVEGQDMREHLMQKYGISAEKAIKSCRDYERGAALALIFVLLKACACVTPLKRTNFALGRKYRETTGTKNALFVAHFRDHQDISNNEILLEIVQQIGMDAQEAKAVLADERFAHLVRDKEQQWQEMGIHSQPFYFK